MSTVIAAVVAPPFGTGTHARAQTYGTARRYASVQRPARAQGPEGVEPHLVFQEDFEHNIGSTPVPLTSYTGAPPLNMTYTADPAWRPKLSGEPTFDNGQNNCNGEIINYNMDVNPSNCNETPNNYDSTGMQNLRALAEALGTFRRVQDPQPTTLWRPTPIPEPPFR